VFVCKIDQCVEKASVCVDPCVEKRSVCVCVSKKASVCVDPRVEKASPLSREGECVCRSAC